MMGIVVTNNCEVDRGDEKVAKVRGGHEVCRESDDIKRRPIKGHADTINLQSAIGEVVKVDV